MWRTLDSTLHDLSLLPGSTLYAQAQPCRSHKEDVRENQYFKLFWVGLQHFLDLSIVNMILFPHKVKLNEPLISPFHLIHPAKSLFIYLLCVMQNNHIGKEDFIKNRSNFTHTNDYFASIFSLVYKHLKCPIICTFMCWVSPIILEIHANFFLVLVIITTIAIGFQYVILRFVLFIFSYYLHKRSHVHKCVGASTNRLYPFPLNICIVFWIMVSQQQL